MPVGGPVAFPGSRRSAKSVKRKKGVMEGEKENEMEMGGGDDVEKGEEGEEGGEGSGEEIVGCDDWVVIEDGEVRGK